MNFKPHLALVALSVLSFVLSSSFAFALDPASQTTTITTVTRTIPVGFIEGNDIARTEQRQVQAFNQVAVNGPFNVKIKGQRDQMVRVKADENLVPYIVTEVRGDTLHIYTIPGFTTNDKLKVEIHSRSLRNLVAMDQAKVAVSDINTAKLNVEESGSAEVSLSGSSTQLTATLSGDSTLKASHLRADNVNIRQMDTSFAEVYATNNLDLDVSGAAKLFYYGNPDNIQRNVIGTARNTPR